MDLKARSGRNRGSKTQQEKLLDDQLDARPSSSNADQGAVGPACHHAEEDGLEQPRRRLRSSAPDGNASDPNRGHSAGSAPTSAPPSRKLPPRADTGGDDIALHDNRSAGAAFHSGNAVADSLGAVGRRPTGLPPLPPAPPAPPVPRDELRRIKYQLYTAAGQPLPPSSTARLAAAAELLDAAARQRQRNTELAIDGSSNSSGGGGDEYGSQPMSMSQAGEPMEMSQQQPMSQQDPMDLSQQQLLVPQSPDRSRGTGAVGTDGQRGGEGEGGLAEAGQAEAAAGAPPSPLPEYASWPVLRLQTQDGPKTAFVAPSMVDKVIREHGLAAAVPKRRGCFSSSG